MPHTLVNVLETRRTFLRTAATGTLAATVPWVAAQEAAKPRRDLARQLGVTTGSFVKHLSKSRADGKLRLLDLPKIMRDELDLKVIDLMTATLPAWEPDYLDELKGKAAEAGCVITNLKMNQKDFDMASPDADTRKRALDEYRRSIARSAGFSRERRERSRRFIPTCAIWNSASSGSTSFWPPPCCTICERTTSGDPSFKSSTRP